jgi:hypothetical protein
VAEAYVLTGKSFEKRGKDMLIEQSLQGTLTVQEV